MFTDERDFHSSGPIVMPDQGIVLIRDKRKINPLWKFAGGKKQLVKPFGKKRRGEAPLECFIRESWEETGLRIKKREVEYVLTQDEGTHNKHFFLSRLSAFQKPKPLSNEYEETKIFTIQDLKWLPDFHPSYRSIFYEHMMPLIEAGY